MKKIVLGLFALSIAIGVNAQEAANKKVQAGLTLGFGMNFQKMGTKILDRDGAGNDFTIGANVNFGMGENQNIAFNTGIEFDFETIKYKSTANDDVFYWYNDATIRQLEDVNTTTDQLFQLSTRRQKPLYVSIPTMLVFRTNFIGYFRYFGKFGLRNSFLLSQKINDTGFNHDPDVAGTGTQTAGTNEDMNAPGDMFFFKSAVGLAGGAEWNFTGSTSLVAEIGYYYGFTPLHLDRNTEKTTLYTAAGVNGTTSNNNFSNQATQQQLMFKVSILF